MSQNLAWNTFLGASPGSGLWIFVGGVAHGAELGHEEVVAPVVRGRVLLDVGELYKLEEEEDVSLSSPAIASMLTLKAADKLLMLTADANRTAVKARPGPARCNRLPLAARPFLAAPKLVGSV